MTNDKVPVTNGAGPSQYCKRCQFAHAGQDAFNGKPKATVFPAIVGNFAGC
jgi:hypothetical protein